MKKILIADVIKESQIPEIGDIEDSGIDHIEYLIQEVEAGRMELDDAQEDAWVYYGYPEDDTKTSYHESSTHGELFGGNAESTISVSYSPIFESLGDTLDDTPYWEVYISIDTSGSSPHHYEGYADNKELEAIEDLEQSASVMQWFNEYCGDHRYS